MVFEMNDEEQAGAWYGCDFISGFLSTGGEGRNGALGNEVGGGVWELRMSGSGCKSHIDNNVSSCS